MADYRENRTDPVIRDRTDYGWGSAWGWVLGIILVIALIWIIWAAFDTEPVYDEGAIPAAGVERVEPLEQDRVVEPVEPAEPAPLPQTVD